jgi:hypothetical protein
MGVEVGIRPQAYSFQNFKLLFLSNILSPNMLFSPLESCLPSKLLEAEQLIVLGKVIAFLGCLPAIAIPTPSCTCLTPGFLLGCDQASPMDMLLEPHHFYFRSSFSDILWH